MWFSIASRIQIRTIHIGPNILEHTNRVSVVIMDIWLIIIRKILYASGILPINIHDFWSATSGYFLQIWRYETLSASSRNGLTTWTEKCVGAFFSYSLSFFFWSLCCLFLVNLPHAHILNYSTRNVYTKEIISSVHLM
jgi:hypothetical protein